MKLICMIETIGELCEGDRIKAILREWSRDINLFNLNFEQVRSHVREHLTECIRRNSARFLSVLMIRISTTLNWRGRDSMDSSVCLPAFYKGTCSVLQSLLDTFHLSMQHDDLREA